MLGKEPSAHLQVSADYDPIETRITAEEKPITVDVMDRLQQPDLDPQRRTASVKPCPNVDPRLHKRPGNWARRYQRNSAYGAACCGSDSNGYYEFILNVRSPGRKRSS